MSFSFLPEKLNLDGCFNSTVRKLYDVFERDVKNNRIFYSTLPVVFDNRKIESEYEEGFWHLISRGKADRTPDFKRAKRLVWLRPLILNSDHPEVHKWNENELDRKGQMVQKTYIWYKAGKYLIILVEKPRRYFLATAFYVTGKRNERYYWSKYSEAKKRGIGV